MSEENKITYFASGNGDTVLIEANGKTILTDLNYKKAQAEDENNDDCPDFSQDIKTACDDDHLNLFVLTHPDKDHLTGFEEMFHLGSPDGWHSIPDYLRSTILVDEMWVSNYCVSNKCKPTEYSKPVLDEIKRREKLIGTLEGNQDGNRLQILNTSTHSSGEVFEGCKWQLLAPTAEEADIPLSDDPDKPNSSNPSSLVIVWTIVIDGGENKILLGGDSTVEIWERIYETVFKNDPDLLTWHILLALHHCSRHSIGRVINAGDIDEEYEHSEKAELALSRQIGNGYIVSSSKRIIRGAKTPPSFHAKNRYLNILARNGRITDVERKRFLCTGGNNATDKPCHIEFSLTASGPARRNIKGGVASVPLISAVRRGGGYGNNI